MKNRFCTKSIKSHIIIYFSGIFIVFSSLLGLIGYRFFSDTLEGEILTYTNKIVEESKINIDSYFSQIRTLMQITGSNSIIMEGLKDEEATDYQKRLNYNRAITDFLQGELKFNSQIKDFIIVDKYGRGYQYTGEAIQEKYDFYSQQWFPKFPDKYFKTTFIGVHPQDYYINQFDTGEEVISAIIPILNFSNLDRKPYGAVVCNLNVKNIQEVTKETRLEKSGFFLIVDNEGQIIFKPKNFNIETSIKNELTQNIKGENGNFVLKNESKQMITVYSTSKVTGWKVVALIPKDEVLSHLSSIRRFILVGIILCIILVIAASFFVSSKITKPIVRLMKKMEQIEQGNFDIKLHDNSSEEIEVLSKRIDIMIERINILNRDIYSYQIQSKEAELRSLQSQINPHFLYNTLQGIKAMAVCDRTNEVSRMVTLIGNMLRYSIYNSNEFASIQDEINHVTEYLQIQDYRYPGKIDFKIQCSKEVENLKTLKLILQPIVENSVIHGLRDRKRGVININICRDESTVVLEVWDNGSGMDKERIEEIMDYINDVNQKDNSKSIGLKNVHERIRLKFGNDFGLIMKSEINKGTCVVITIPIINSLGGDKNGNDDSR